MPLWVRSTKRLGISLCIQILECSKKLNYAAGDEQTEAHSPDSCFHVAAHPGARKEDQSIK